MLDLTILRDYAGGVNRLRSVLALFLLVVSGALASPAQSNLGGGTPNISGTLIPNNCIKAGPGTNQIQDSGAACGSGSGTVTGVTGGSGINVSGGPPSPTVSLLNPFMGVLTINGVNSTATGGFNATNLCTGLKAINDNPSVFVYKVVDALPYDSEAKDPWNDVTCANGFPATNGALTYEFGNMNFIVGWGGTLHLPAGAVTITHGRGSESQLSLTNGCGTATPTQCSGTVFAAYNTAAPWTGSFAMTCPGCTVFPTSTPGIDYAGSGVSSFGTQLNGPLTITMAGIAGSTCMQNTGAQENSSIRDVTCAGAQSFGIDASQSTAQNFHMGPGIEIISGLKTGATIGTPTAFVGVKWSVNGPNRDLDNVTCNPRGAATTTSIAACIEIVGPGGSRMPSGHVHHVHTENVKIAVLVDGARNIKIDNINTGSATQDGSTPTAMVYICGASSPAPCTTGLTSSKIKFDTSTIISPSLMPNYVIDDTNTKTITAPQWTGEYDTDPPKYGSPLLLADGGLGPFPTTPNSVPQIPVCTPSAGVCIPVWSLGGVPVDATNPATLLVTNRATYLPWTSGSALALPAVAGNFALNLPFVLKNTAGVTLTLTPNAGASDLIDGGASTPVLNNFLAWVWQDSTTAPGHWFTAKVPTFAAFGATGNVCSWSTTTGFSCNNALINGTTATTQADGDNTTKVASDQFVTTAVSNAIAAVNPAVAVEAASAAVLPNSPTYSNGVAGIGATLTTATTNTPLVVDGYTPILNDRILVKNQASAFQNGVYIVTQVSGVALAWILTRALDYDQPSDMNNTGAIPVVNGTANTKTQWLQTSTVNTVGTDAVTFTQFSVAPIVTASPNTLVAGPSTFGAAAAAPTARALVAHDMPAGFHSCAVLDNAICTSSVDASGNPNFLGTAGNTTLPINGGTTSLVMFIGGVYQVLNTNVTLTLPATAGQYWILAKQDLANENMVAADFIVSAYPPFNDWAVHPRGCPTNPQGLAVSATNPVYWFNLAANQAYTCTSNGGSFTAAATPLFPIGVCDVTVTPSIDACAPYSFRQNPYRIRSLYGDGSGGNLASVSSAVAIGSTTNVTLGAGGTGYSNGLTLTLPCGATVTVSGNTAGVVNAITGPVAVGNSCVVANGYATTSSGAGTGATVNITGIGNAPNYPLSVTVLSSGVLTASSKVAGITPSNRGIGLAITTQNPVLALGTGIINANAMAKTVNGTTGAGSSSTEAGGMAGLGGGGGGSSTQSGGQSGCLMKPGTGNCTDNAVGGGVNTAGANGGFGPAFSALVSTTSTILPDGGSLTCLFAAAPGYGSSGGPGAGDGTNAGGNGGSAGGRLCLRGPSIVEGASATLSANGGTGGNSASAGNPGGGGGGGGGSTDLMFGWLSLSGTTTSNAGAGGSGFGTGGAGGTGTAGPVFAQRNP